MTIQTLVEVQHHNRQFLLKAAEMGRTFGEGMQWFDGQHQVAVHAILIFKISKVFFKGSGRMLIFTSKRQV